MKRLVGTKINEIIICSSIENVMITKKNKQ